MHRQQRHKLRVPELQMPVTSSESHTKLKEEGDNPIRVRNGTDPQYSGAAKHELRRVSKGTVVDCRETMVASQIAMRGLAGGMCAPPLLTDLRRAVLNPTDPYSVSLVKKSGYSTEMRGVV